MLPVHRALHSSQGLVNYRWAEHFPESYQGVICHDCWSAQTKTPAGARQLCHVHLVRNLPYAMNVDNRVSIAVKRIAQDGSGCTVVRNRFGA